MRRQRDSFNSSARTRAFFTTCAAYFLNAGVSGLFQGNRYRGNLIQVRSALQSREDGFVYLLIEITPRLS